MGKLTPFFILMLVALPIAQVYSLTQEKSVGGYLSEGLFSIGIACAFLIKPEFFAEEIFGAWFLEWSILFAVAYIVSGACELFQGLKKL